MTASLPATRLGWTDMHLTRVGFGAWALGGGGWAYAWGDQDDTASVAAIRHAVESGINWIDTAAAYGLGHSEEVVAAAPADLPEADRPYVFTEPAVSANLALAHALRPVAARHGVTTAAVAVAWTLAFPAVTGAIVGARSPRQVDGWLPAATLELKDDDLSAIADAIRATGAGTGPVS